MGSIWFLYNLFTSVRFRVDYVSIEKASLVSRDDVERVANVRNNSIFRVNTEDVERRLKAAFGCIERALVTCKLPDQVTIEVEEHDQVFVWESAGRYWWVDIQGDVLGMTDDPGQLLVIHDLDLIAPDPQEYIIGVPWELGEEMAEVLPDIGSYDYGRAEGLILYVTANRWPVLLGHQGDALAKIALMRALTNELAAKGIDVEYIDLRNEQRPTFEQR